MVSEGKPLKITDTILRDAHQSLLATRMRTEDMLPIAEKLDSVGYFSVEMWGGATFDSCLRFLNENPWDRSRELKKRMSKTPFQMLLRGQNLLGYRHYADDIVDRFVKKSADVGIDIFRIFDALNDFRNIRRAVEIAKKCNKTVEGTLSYTVSPVHNVALYVKKAKELENMGSDIICIKDMAGLLTPAVTRSLVSEIKKTVKLPVHLHTHATTGLVGMNLQCAIEAGVDIVDTAISALAMGTSQFATECVVASLKDTSRDTGLDLDALHEISDYFKEVKKKYTEFESDFKSVDVKILESQIPGGMISNMENQLKEQNAADKIDEVLQEVPRVRKDLGYPPLVTPTSQIVGSQATLNVLTGERYKVVTRETRDCMLGKYGQLPGKLDQELLAKVAEDEKIIDCRPADLLKPEWDTVVKECKGKVTEEEDLLSYAMFPKVALKFFETRQQLRPETGLSKSGVQQTTTPGPQVSTSTMDISAPVPTASGSASSYTISVNGKPYSVQVVPTGSIGTSSPQPPPTSSISTVASNPSPTNTTIRETVTAKLPGTVLTINVKVGDSVNAGDTLLILEAMKMETEVKADTGGVIGSILVQEGGKVAAGDQLVLLN